MEKLTQRIVNVRDVTEVHGYFSQDKLEEDGTYVYQFILDHGVDEGTYQLNESDADQILDLIKGADTVQYDTDQKVLIFKSLKGA